MRDDEKMDSEEFRRELADLHGQNPPVERQEDADTSPRRPAGEEVPYAEESPRDRGPEQARRAIDEDEDESGFGQGAPEGQLSEVSSLRTPATGDNDSVGTEEVMPPADLAQQRAQGPGHDYRVGVRDETADEDVEVMPRSKYRAEDDAERDEVRDRNEARDSDAAGDRTERRGVHERHGADQRVAREERDERG